MEMRIQSFLQFSILLLSVSAMNAFAIDLKYSDLDRITLEGNSSIAASELRWQAQDKRTGFFSKSFAPRFDLGIGQEIFQTGTYLEKNEPYGNIAATINLFNGFRDLNEGRVRTAHAVYEKSESLITRQEKLSASRQLYLQLAYCKELESTYRTIQETNTRVKKSAQIRQNRGLVTNTDIHEFDLYANRIKEEIESLHHERELVSVRLSAALGMEPTREINPLDRLEHDHHDDRITRDYRKVATVGLLKIQALDSIKSAEASYRAAWWLPSVDVYAGYYVYTLRERDYLAYQDRDDWAAGVRATWSLFNFELYSQSKASSIEEKASQLDKKQKDRDFNAEVISKQGELLHLHELIHNSEERLKLVEQYLRSTQSDYDRGVKNSPDVISAIDKLIATQKELLERKLDYHRTHDRLVTLTQEI